MPYDRLLRSGRIRPHRTNPQEIAGLFQVVERDLTDASITALSADRRFATACNAALQTAIAVMYSEGYAHTTSVTTRPPSNSSKRRWAPRLHCSPITSMIAGASATEPTTSEQVVSP